MKARIPLSIVASAFLMGASPHETQIVDVVGTYYMSYFQGTYEEVFRVPSSSFIYGHGLISDTVAVFSYQDPEKTLASAIVDAISLESGELLDRFSFNYAGESSFSFNGERGVFNDMEGLKVIRFVDQKFSVTTVMTDVDYPIAPFWINSETVGFSYFNEGKMLFGEVAAPAN